MKLRRMEKIKIPSMQEISRERIRLQYQNRYRAVLRSTIYSLVVVAAAAVLLATLFFPVLQVSGASMEPTLFDRDILLLVKNDHYKTGDLCSFGWQNKLLIKRIIGGPGDVIDIAENGVVRNFRIRYRKIVTLYWGITEVYQLTAATVRSGV